MKTKSLVDVIVDDAFASFPVDSERYELTAAVHILVRHNMLYVDLYQHENWRINDWLDKWVKGVDRAVTCYRLHVIHKVDMTGDPDMKWVDLLMKALPASVGIASVVGEDGVAFDNWMQLVIWRLVTKRLSGSMHQQLSLL